MRQTIVVRRMAAPGDRVLVGVSGGPDSMTLLHLLNRLAPTLDIDLGVAHLDHGLRGAAARQDAERVRRTAAAMGLACHVVHARVANVRRGLRLSLEAAGHRVRYAFFKRVMADHGYDKLALGHHMDDNAEQVLMALLRGSGHRGLSGIAPVRDDRIIRPLIDARRRQIDAYVVRMGIVCGRDETNDDLGMLRNRIRHRLLPLLADDYNPRIHEDLNRLADVIRTEEQWIAERIEAPYTACIRHRTAETIELGVPHLIAAHRALSRRLVRRCIEDLAGSLKRITFTHVEAVLDLLNAGANEKTLHLPDGIRVRRCGDRLTLTLGGNPRRQTAGGVSGVPAGATDIAAPFPARVENHALGIGLDFTRCDKSALPPWTSVDRRCAYFDRRRLTPPLTLRAARPGDRFQPLGAGGSQKLKKYFIDHRVGRSERAAAAVLTDRRQIIWLVGHRSDERVKITDTTSDILKVEFFLLDTR